MYTVICICINRQLCGVKLGVWRVNTVTSTSQLHQPSTMYSQTGGGGMGINIVTSTLHMYQPSCQTGGVWVCGGLILSLQYHKYINRQLCGVKLEVYGCVEGYYRHFNITTASTVNYVGGCMGVRRVNIVT